MSRYGLDGDLPPLSLPERRSATPKLEPETLKKTKRRAAELGFDDRAPAEPERKARRPGPKPGEPSTKFTINGPVRVIEAFKDYCEARDLPYWKALEYLMAEKPGDA